MAKKTNPRYTSKKAGKIKPNLLAMQKTRRRARENKRKAFKPKGRGKMGSPNIFNFNPFAPMIMVKPKSKYF
jgi:hypothetical protein